MDFKKIANLTFEEPDINRFPAIRLAREALQAGGQSIVSSTDIGALVLSLFFLFLFGITGKKIARWEGGLLLAGYALYMGLLFNIIPVPALLPNV